MNDEIKAGEKVSLKSGGPPMMVRNVDTYAGEDGMQAECEWFDGTTLKRAVFPVVNLAKIKL